VPDFFRHLPSGEDGVSLAARGEASIELAAWIGLVPRQHSTGGKPTLLGISKRGDTYLRTLLIHGGRSVVRVAHKHQDKRNQWIGEVYSPHLDKHPQLL
jgi:transposase